jgi:hypothetical protein
MACKGDTVKENEGIRGDLENLSAAAQSIFENAAESLTILSHRVGKDEKRDLIDFSIDILQKAVQIMDDLSIIQKSIRVVDDEEIRLTRTQNGGEKDE